MEDNIMKKAYRTFATILALAMLLAVGAACGETGGGGAGGGANQPEGGATDLATISPGVLIMATNAEFPPYEFWEGGKIRGIDAEIAEAIAEKLGLELRIDDMDFGAILAAVATGRADMGMAAMTVREDRLENANFTISYATGVQVVIVGSGSPITSVDDLFEDGAFFTIGVQESTTGDFFATEDLEDEGLATIQRFRRGADAVQALVAGRIDAVLIDNEPAKSYVAANTGLYILDTEYAVEEYAIAIALENTELLAAVDGALRELIADGTTARIIASHISAD